MTGPTGAPAYKNEPRPPWWSPWRRWRRALLLLLPVLLGLAALAALLQLAVVAPFAAPALAGAIIGGLIATFGNLLVQYVVALVQDRRVARDRNLREIGIATVLMADLGEALARMRINVQLLKTGNPAAIAHAEEANVSAWDAVKVDAAQMWMPASVFTVSATYTAIRLVNKEIAARSARVSDPEFVPVVEQAVKEIASTVKLLERRTLRVGRE